MYQTILYSFAAKLHCRCYNSAKVRMIIVEKQSANDLHKKVLCCCLNQ